MKILVLPPSAQRRRRDGKPTPYRFFLPDGTELPGVVHFEASLEREWDMLETTQIQEQPARGGKGRTVVTKLTLTFGPSEVVRISKLPKRGDRRST